MDTIDKTKLKVLIKMILIQKSPKSLTSKQLVGIINKYDWGFQTSITTAKVSKLLSVELKKHDKHFLSCIRTDKKRGILVYYYTSK